MAKISLLPDAEPLNGGERVALVQNGETRGSNLSDYLEEAVEPFLSQAETAASFAEEFSGLAYTDRSAGELATIKGQFFRVPIPGTDPIEYTRYQRTAAGSVVAAPLATSAALAAIGGADLVGADDGAGGSIFTTLQGLATKLLSSVAGSVLLFTPFGTGAVARDLQGKMQESVSVTDYGELGTADDTAVMQKAITAVEGTGRVLTVPAGEYIIGALTATDSITIRGQGRGKVTFKWKTDGGLNNMFYAFGGDGIDISGCGFDMQNDVITGNRGEAYLENIFCFISCKNVHIHNNIFCKALNYMIIFNASELAETENVFVYHNIFRDGARGGVFSTRYGRNMHAFDNRMTNVCNESLSGLSYDKSIAMGGVIGGWVERNYVKQTISGGGDIIFEFTDRQSENINILYNYVEGSSGNSYKVGASVGVRAIGNVSIKPGEHGFYIEGCWDFLLDDFYSDGANKNAVRIYEDNPLETGRTNRNIRLGKNTYKNSNTGGADLGTPDVPAGSPNSYHIACRESEDIYISKGYFIDNGASTANGIFMQALDNYEIVENDLRKLKAGVTTLANTGTTGTNFRVENNRGMQTTDEGHATIPAGYSGTGNIEPDVLVDGANPAIECSLASQMSGNAAYIYTSIEGSALFAINIRTAAHGAATTTSDITVFWRYAEKRPRGIFGKTLR